MRRATRLEIVRVRWCVQCEGPLPKRCSSCVKHPDRKPRYVEVFGSPTIIRMAECKCCAEISCQRPTCKGTRFERLDASRTLKDTKNYFCSKKCTALITAEAKLAKRVHAVCSCGCEREVVRPASNMRAQRVYFSQKCHFEHRVKMQHAARMEKIKTAEDGYLQTLWCARCKDVTDHTKRVSKLMQCVRCYLGRAENVGMPTPQSLLVKFPP